MPSFTATSDGATGIFITDTPAITVIEAFGSTSLVQVGNNYFLNPVAGGTGPELKSVGCRCRGGSVWRLRCRLARSRRQADTRLPGRRAPDQYAVWNTDSSGNYVSYAMLSGASSTLESLETSFQQDLNGDGVIGVPTL